MSVAELAPVIARIEARLGTSCRGTRADVTAAVLRTAMATAGERDPARYARRLDEDADERANLAEQLRVPETYFLREARQLDLLRQRVLPALAEHVGGSPLQLWSAGCASGEEAYSLAIAREQAGLAGRARILATDRSAVALAAAERGVYGAWSLRSVEPAERGRYFTAHPPSGLLQVADRLRTDVTFRQHDLVTDPFPSGLDVIVCRNVLLYLTPDHGARLVERLTAALAPGGWLLLGSTDPHHDAATLLEPVRTPAGPVYRRAGGPCAVLTAPRQRDRHQRDVPPPPPPATLTPVPTPVPSAPTPDASPAATDAERRSLAGPEGGVDDLERCERALADEPLEPALHVQHGTLLLEAGHADAARRAATAALFLAPELAAGHLLLGRACLALDEPADAARSFRTVVQLLDTVADRAPVDGATVPAGRLRAIAEAAAVRAAAGAVRADARSDP